MPLLFILGILLVAATAALVTRAIALSRVRMVSQLRQIESYGFNVGEAREGSRGEHASAAAHLNELAARIGRATQGDGWFAPVTGIKLRAAGLYKLTPEMFHGYRVMLAAGLPSLILLDGVLAGSFSFMTVLLMFLAGALAWSGPALVASSRAQRRMNLVYSDLPEMIDLLIATVEAGLGFAVSLQLVAYR